MNSQTHRESGSTVDSLVLRKVTDVCSIILGPLLEQHRVVLFVESRACRTIPPFSECHFSILVGVSDRIEVAMTSSQLS